MNLEFTRITKLGQIKIKLLVKKAEIKIKDKDKR